MSCPNTDGAHYDGKCLCLGECCNADGGEFCICTHPDHDKNRCLAEHPKETQVSESRGEFSSGLEGRWKYSQADGINSLLVERSVVHGRPGWVAVKSAGGPYVWVHPDDVEELIKKIRDAARPVCRACNGTGVRK